MNRKHQILIQKKTKKFTNKLRIITLGGQEEVGRNMTVFEYGHDIVILDMGIQFPEEDMPGIDYIIPNTAYLQGKEKNVRGVIFSHGHLDHIGAAPILLEKLKTPTVVGRPLTLALIKNRMEDYKKGSAKYLRSINVKSAQQVIKLGQFTIKFFPVDHSIMDAIGVIIQTPLGTIIHPGDWTYEKNPLTRQPITYHHLAKLPKPTILMLESLGSTAMKERIPERTMYQNLDQLIRQAPGRIIIGTFSSQLERIKWVIERASILGKKIALDGYSMKVNVEVAKQLGYIKVKKGSLITVDQINKFPDRRVIIMCTGAQGEPRAVLSRIISKNHRFIKIKKQDTVVFSSSIIPGNERTIQKLKDNLYRLCDNVVHTEIMDVHSSGHSNAQDLITVVKQIRPTYFLPVYANHYYLKEAEKLAIRNGYPKNNIFILDNGSVLELANNKAQILPKKVPSHYIFVDGLGVGDVSNVVLRDRQLLAGDGMFVIIVTIDSKTGNIINSPDIISRGFIYMKENKTLLEQVRKKVKQILTDKEPRAKADDVYIKNKIRDQIGQFLFTKTERRPMVMPVVIKV
ncbi:ribonuclease J [Patescibacteria group bacterium]|nr:ribonuclease J [Patescibacteria group bacterium]